MAASYPSVTDARVLAKKHKLERCVVFFTASDGRMGYASYGKTRRLCDTTRETADAMWDECWVWGGKLPEKEPTD